MKSRRCYLDVVFEKIAEEEEKEKKSDPRQETKHFISVALTVNNRKIDYGGHIMAKLITLNH